MKVNWSAVVQTGISIASIIVPQIGVVEQIAKAVPALRGAVKEDAVVALTREILEAHASKDGIDLVKLTADPQFEAAIREFIRGYVALQNAVSSKP